MFPGILIGFDICNLKLFPIKNRFSIVPSLQSINGVENDGGVVPAAPCGLLLRCCCCSCTVLYAAASTAALLLLASLLLLRRCAAAAPLLL